MNTARWFARTSVVIGCLGVAAFLSSAQAALVVTGPATAAPGESITLTIALDAALAVDIDEMQLRLSFDPAVLHPGAAAAGALLAGSSFAANAGTGLALISFGATLATLGPGELATWSFEVAPGAIPSAQTLASATLDTFTIDSPPTANLFSNAHTITVVPEPASRALLAVGICVLGACARRRVRAALRVA